jgi:hypothetical protein
VLASNCIKKVEVLEYPELGESISMLSLFWGLICVFFYVFSVLCSICSGVSWRLHEEGGEAGAPGAR